MCITHISLSLSVCVCVCMYLYMVLLFHIFNIFHDLSLYLCHSRCLWETTCMLTIAIIQTHTNISSNDNTHNLLSKSKCYYYILIVCQFERMHFGYHYYFNQVFFSVTFVRDFHQYFMAQT